MTLTFEEWQQVRGVMETAKTFLEPSAAAVSEVLKDAYTEALTSLPADTIHAICDANNA